MQSDLEKQGNSANHARAKTHWVVQLLSSTEDSLADLQLDELTHMSKSHAASLLPEDIAPQKIAKYEDLDKMLDEADHQQKLSSETLTADFGSDKSRSLSYPPLAPLFDSSLISRGLHLSSRLSYLAVKLFNTFEILAESSQEDVDFQLLICHKLANIAASSSASADNRNPISEPEWTSISSDMISIKTEIQRFIHNAISFSSSAPAYWAPMKSVSLLIDEILSAHHDSVIKCTALVRLLLAEIASCKYFVGRFCANNAVNYAAEACVSTQESADTLGAQLIFASGLQPAHLITLPGFAASASSPIRFVFSQQVIQVSHEVALSNRLCKLVQLRSLGRFLVDSISTYRAQHCQEDFDTFQSCLAEMCHNFRLSKLFFSVSSEYESVLFALESLAKLAAQSPFPSITEFQAVLSKLPTAFTSCFDARYSKVWSLLFLPAARYFVQGLELLRPAVQLFNSPDSNYPLSSSIYSKMQACLSYCCVLVGLIRVHTLLPNSQMDPASTYVIRVADLKRKESDLELDIAVSDWTNTISASAAGAAQQCSSAGPLPGINIREQCNLAAVDCIRTTAKHLAPDVIIRNKNGAAFSELQKAINAFTSNVLEMGNMANIASQLLQLVDSAALAKSSEAFLRQEELFQSTSGEFIRRLETHFRTDFNDIVSPLCDGVFQIQRGLRVLAHLAKICPKQTEESDSFASGRLSALEQLTRFPVSARLNGGTVNAFLQSARSLLAADVLVDMDKLGDAVVSIFRNEAQEANEKPSSQSNISFRAKIQSVGAKQLRMSILKTVMHKVLLQVSESNQLGCSQTFQLSATLSDALDLIFRSFIRMWKRGQAAKAAAAAAEQSMYRWKEDESKGKSQAQEDEEVLQEMYPDFANDFADILATQTMSDQEILGETSEEKRLPAPVVSEEKPELTSDLIAGSIDLDSDQMGEIFSVFYMIFAGWSRSSTWTGSELRMSALSHSYRTAGIILDHMLISRDFSIPKRFDDSAACAQLFMLATSHRLLSNLQKPAPKTASSSVLAGSLSNVDSLFSLVCADLLRSPLSSTHSAAELTSADPLKGWINPKQQANSDVTIELDVWTQGDINEIRRLERPLIQLMTRVRQLLCEYPAHPLLIVLIKLAHRIASLPCSTPVMKLLAGVELLLHKAEEWEANASKAVSIGPDLRDFSILVARWRRMELRAWPRALRFKEASFTQNATKWWFHLYTLMHCKPSDLQTFVSQQNETEESVTNERNSELAYLGQLYTAVDDFMQSSNCGELGTRLEILVCFRNQLESELHFQRKDCLRQELRQKIIAMLSCMQKFYLNLLPHVQEYVHTNRASIEKFIKDQVKLAKWDLSNYWSLKESSDKSHRKLNKLARDYQLILETPFSKILSNLEGADCAEGVDYVNFDFVGRDYTAAKLALAEPKSKGTRKEARKKSKDGEQQQQSEPDSDDVAQKLCPDLPDKELFLIDITKRGFHFDASPPPMSTAAESTDLASIIHDPAQIFLKSVSIIRKGPLSKEALRYETQVAQTIEGIGIDCIQRAADLASAGTRIMEKKKAVVDLLKLCKQTGLSYHLAVVNTVRAQMNSLLNLPDSNQMESHQMVVPLDRCFGNTNEFASKFNIAAEVSTETSQLAEKCESYMARVALGLKRLRVRILSHHRDLTAREAVKCRGYSEHLFTLLALKRTQLSSFSPHLKQLRYFKSFLTAFGSSAELPEYTSFAASVAKQGGCRAYLGALKDSADVMLSCQLHNIDLCKRVGQVRRCFAFLCYFASLFICLFFVLLLLLCSFASSLFFFLFLSKFN